MDHVVFPTAVFEEDDSSEPTMNVNESNAGDSDTNAKTWKTSNEAMNNLEKFNCGFNHIGSPTVSAHEREAGYIDCNVEAQQKLVCP